MALLKYIFFLNQIAFLEKVLRNWAESFFVVYK